MRQTSQNRGFCAFEGRLRRRRKRPTGANFKLQVVLLVSPRLSYKLVWVGRKERPAACRSKGNGNGTVDPEHSGKERHKARRTIHARYGALLGNPHIDTM
jgi:hypothetical protein